MQATVDDIRKFGMIPEFIGRLPIMFSLEALTEDMLVKILKEPKNAIIKQYQKLLEMDEVRLSSMTMHSMPSQDGKGEEGRSQSTSCDYRGFHARYHV